ncbi:hypothetical protein [Desulfogranum japonicum]|uniref:hypothetical protein n=1 Tax=Desulfogranum japonicum TaxID=231447 RepID=UPI0012946DB1|nr:hypothetical protein [Desulfogranum japonicum]
MMKKIAIQESHLVEAKNNKDNTWLVKTYNEAVEVISNGGEVDIVRSLSDNSNELIERIGSVKQLHLYFPHQAE